MRGPCRPGSMAAVLAGADAVLFPVRWAEPWGRVAIEAMATGRPVVATGRGGSAEYLRHEHNALVVAPDDAAALAAAVARLAAGPGPAPRHRGRIAQPGGEVVEVAVEDARAGLAQDALDGGDRARRGGRDRRYAGGQEGRQARGQVEVVSGRPPEVTAVGGTDRV